MASKRFVIIGNGTAGNVAAKVLRDGDKEATITLISAEPTHYLIRHKMAQFLVTPEVSIDKLNINSPEFYEENCLQLRLNQPVTRVDPKEKKVHLAHREVVPYDKLLICSGARHRIPEYLSHFSKLLTRFCTGKDAILLRKRIDSVKHVTMLGGDCVGLQLARALQPTGRKICMILDDRKFWPIEFDDEKVRDKMVKALEARGIDVVTGDFVAEIAGTIESMTLKLRSGREIKTDAAILSSGMTPRLEFLDTSGVDVQEGVLVNSKLETSADDVWAAGECAQAYFPALKDYRCSTGYHNAEIQGAIAAKNMLGQSAELGLPDPGKVMIGDHEFVTYGWRGFSLDAKN